MTDFFSSSPVKIMLSALSFALGAVLPAFSTTSRFWSSWDEGVLIGLCRRLIVHSTGATLFGGRFRDEWDRVGLGSAVAL